MAEFNLPAGVYRLRVTGHTSEDGLFVDVASDEGWQSTEWLLDVWEFTLNSPGMVYTRTQGLAGDWVEFVVEQKMEAPEPAEPPIVSYDNPAIVPAAVSSELDDGGEERIHIAPYVEPPAVVPPVETGELCINFAEGLQVLESELIGLGFDVNGQTITATWGGDRKFYLDLNGDPIIYAYGDYVNDEGVEVELTDGARTVIVTTKLAGYLYSDAGGIIYDLGDFSWFEGDSFDLEWYIEGGGRGTWVRDGTMFFPTAWNFPPNEFVFGKFIADDEEYCAVFDRWEG